MTLLWAEAPRPERPIPQSRVTAAETDAESYVPTLDRQPPRRVRRAHRKGAVK